MGALIRSRALGLLKMENEAGNDSKILVAPVTKVLLTYKHFKDLEAGKKVSVKGWSNKKQAENEIEKSCKRYFDHLDT